MKNTAKKIYIALIFLFLYAPIATLMVLSFNASKTRAKWGGFTFKWYTRLIQNDDILKALGNTLLIALLSSVIATVIGTVACIAMNHMKKRTRTVMMGITNIPMLNADIVTGISLMLLFISFGFRFGFGTILLSHITFNIPYVILSVMPRMKQLNPSIYEAALDLGATPLTALVRIVIPQIFPGILSGFALAVTLSLDDYFVATYTKPATFDTISTYVVNATKGAQTTIKTALWALSTVIFLLVVLFTVVMNLRAQKAGQERSGI